MLLWEKVARNRLSYMQDRFLRLNCLGQLLISSAVKKKNHQKQGLLVKAGDLFIASFLSNVFYVCIHRDFDSDKNVTLNHGLQQNLYLGWRSCRCECNRLDGLGLSWFSYRLLLSFVFNAFLNDLGGNPFKTSDNSSYTSSPVLLRFIYS